MTYSHLTTAELTTIANFFTQGTKAYAPMSINGTSFSKHSF